MIESLVLSHQVPEDWRAQAEVFNEIFFVFLTVGTIVGIVVVAYTLHHAYKYRDTGDEDPSDPPVLGELPSGQEGGKGKKLFFSFGLSAIIVISLVVYAYGLLLYVEQGPTEDVESDIEIEVVGFQFGWEFVYENGHSQLNEMYVPEGAVVELEVTSRDVWHNFGVPDLRIKEDSIPGQTARTWFIASEAGDEHTIRCYELCGVGHSEMDGQIIVMDDDEFDEWYEETEPDDGDANDGNNADNGSDANDDNDADDTHRQGVYS